MKTCQTSFIEVRDGFLRPPASCTLIPFWFLNDKVDGEEYCRQIDEMAAHGVRQAMPHPRYGMDRRDYLTDRYWEAIGSLAKHASDMGFTLHLYDEYNWSSGAGGSRVTEKREQCALGLGMRSRRAEGPATVTVDGWEDNLYGWAQREQYLSVVLAPVHADGALDLAQARSLETPAAGGDVVTVDIPAGQWEVMVFYTLRTLHPSPLRMGNGGIIDYLNPDSTKDFITCTHEQYAAHLGEYFGTTIPTIFYDESIPIASGPFTWTGDFVAQFQARTGYDLLPLLPLLFVDGGDRTEKVRCDYWDTVAALFTERHIQALADWATAHGLQLIGHTFEEPERWMLAGDPMRTLRIQHWPGLDSLTGYQPFHAFKIASSVPHLQGKSELLCESLGLMGFWTASPRMIKEANNQLAIVGVTHQVPHAFYQSIDNPKVECPPSFFEHNPYWKYYDQIADLVARQCWMNRQGQPVVDIAVFFPLVSWWGDAAGGRGYDYPWAIQTLETSPSVPDNQAFREIINTLIGHQLDHDVIDGQGLADAAFDNGEMRVAQMAYRVLVLPPMRTIRLTDLERIVAFARQGGVVVCVGQWPSVSMEHGRKDARLQALVAELQQLATFVPTIDLLPEMIRDTMVPDVALLQGDPAQIEVAHRRGDDWEMYIIHHHAPEAGEVRLRLRAQGTASVWDPEHATVMPLDVHPCEDGSVVTLEMLPNQCLYVLFGTLETQESFTTIAPKGAIAHTMDITEGWQCVPVPTELDTIWSCEAGPQEVAVPVYRTRELQYIATGHDAHVWREWYQPGFDDSAWELVHCLRGPLLYSDQGSRLFRTQIPLGATALKLPLPIEKEFALYINGKLTMVVNSHLPEQTGWLELPELRQGGVIAIESSSQAPDCGLTGPLVFRCEPTPVALCSWTEQGLWWYTGRAFYRREVELAKLEGTVFLNLGEVRECAEVWVNGRLVGTRIWPPYCVEITEYLREGKNEITVIVANLLANRFAWDVWGTRGQGETRASGLLGPVTLECSDR